MEGQTERVVAVHVDVGLLRGEAHPREQKRVEEETKLHI